MASADIGANGCASKSLYYCIENQIELNCIVSFFTLQTSLVLLQLRAELFILWFWVAFSCSFSMQTYSVSLLSFRAVATNICKMHHGTGLSLAISCGCRIQRINEIDTLMVAGGRF